jgi:hypothetical protein
MDTGLSYLNYKGVTVYRTEKDGEPGILRQFAYSLKNDGNEYGPTVFDVRELPTWTGTGAVVLAPGIYPISLEHDQIVAAMKLAIDKGLLRA